MNKYIFPEESDLDEYFEAFWEAAGFPRSTTPTTSHYTKEDISALYSELSENEYDKTDIS